MTFPHPLEVAAPSQSDLEKVSPHFIHDGLLRAREKSWQVLVDAKKELKEGMNERNIKAMVLDLFSDYGVKQHWHKPYIRFGAGTIRTFHDSPMEDHHILKKGDLCYMDFGPVWSDDESELFYEGDVGETFIFCEEEVQKNQNLDEKRHLIRSLKELFELGASLWKEHSCTGNELYKALETGAKERDVLFNVDVKGHRLSDFPHFKYSKERLSQLKFSPSDSLWVLEIHITDLKKRWGGFYEDLLHRS